MIDFEKNWQLAKDKGAEIIGAQPKAGDFDHEGFAEQAASSWLKSLSQDAARNWLVDSSLAYLKAEKTGECITKALEHNLHFSTGYSGYWVVHLMSLQLLAQPDVDLQSQWNTIERGVLAYLRYSNRESVVGLLMETMNCAQFYREKGLGICNQTLIRQAHSVLNARTHTFWGQGKLPGFFLFCPPHWPEGAMQSIFVAEASRFLAENPEVARCLKGTRGSALKRLYQVYDVQILGCYLNSRQLEDKFLHDLGL
jgi:hypothetical protein